MLSHVWHALLLATTVPGYPLCIATDDDTYNKARILGRPSPAALQRCASRIEATMEAMKKRQTLQSSASLSSKASLLDLTGYALHQPLRTAPYDMYVTSMRVRVPSGNNWYRIEQCTFNPRNRTLDTQLSFRDLSVSGVVKLYNENAVFHDPLLPPPADVCNMTLRLRKAGLEISVTPRHVGHGPVDIQTSARFTEPEFVSVYAYGCRPRHAIEHRQGKDEVDVDDADDDGAVASEGRRTPDFTQEMEDVFVRGIQSLLASYMEKQLQTALKETLMMNMGYTISYGK